MPKKKKRSKKLGRPKIDKDLKLDVPDELATPEGIIPQKTAPEEAEQPQDIVQPRYNVWGIVRDNETKLYSSVIIHTDNLDSMHETCMWCSYVRAFMSFENSCFRGNSGPNKGRMI